MGDTQTYPLSRVNQRFQPQRRSNDKLMENNHNAEAKTYLSSNKKTLYSLLHIIPQT